VSWALGKVGLQSPPAEKIVETIGLSLGETLRYLTGETDAGLASRFTRSFHELADQIMDCMTVVYDSVWPVMRSLRAANVRTAIVSTKLNYRIRGILAANYLEESFNVIVGADDVVNPKPDPEGLLLALQRLCVSPACAVYVGDHVVDAQAASNAGIPFVAALSGMHLLSAFEPYPHRAVVQSILDLPRVLGLS